MSGEIDAIADELTKDPLYVDDAAVEELAAEEIEFNDSGLVRTSLENSDEPIYIAVLPSSLASSEPAAVAAAEQIATSTGGGTVLVITGNRNFGTATDQGVDAEALANLALATDGDLGLRLDDFVARVQTTLGTGTGNSSGNNDSDGGSGGWLPLGILVAAGGGGFLYYRRVKRNRELADLEKVRPALEEDITKYGEQLTALDLNLQPTSAVSTESQSEYSQALDLYEDAKMAADRAERPEDLRVVTSALEEGRWLLTCVDARAKDQPIPQRRPPCFFDPSHGPSLEDIMWAPRHGSRRQVPACAADLQRIRQGEEPESRMVQVGEDRYRPYWEAGPAYGGWAGGYYGGLLPGVLIGTALGHAVIPVDAGAAGGDFSTGGGDFGGGFESGGGDFGGFDVGGGDFGGF